MSQPNPLVNGCSLEDCYTNLFALTDLTGIKWRRLSAASHFHCVDPLDDPVLLSFSRCLQADILCVWKRVLKTESADYHRTIDVTSKELWIFWYGEQPTNLRGILSPELIETEQGSWDAGLSYECRTLLFKALHNLIEKCLLSRNFVRLGKWFVQPYDHTATTNDKSSHLSISFTFFLHGESTVCSSIDVRQHPPVRPLVNEHITQAQCTTSGIKVILAPYGLSGVLTGQTYKDTDHHVVKLLEEWKKFYPLDTFEGGGVAEDLVPSMVEVVVGGMRMKYPSCYVLVTDIDVLPDRPLTSTNPGGTRQSTSATTLAPFYDTLEGHRKPGGVYAEDPGGGETNEPMYQCLVEKVWHDQCLVTGQKRPASTPASNPQQQQLSESGDENSVGEWNFSEPVHKAHCGCSKLRSKNRSYQGSQNKEKSFSGNSKWTKLDKSDKSDGKPSKHSRMPFYRRTISHDDVQHDVDLVMTRNRVQLLDNFKGPVQNGSLPLRTTNYEAESPHSAAPSPLVQNGAVGGAAASFDPTMPTLSPHPPVIKDNVQESHQPSSAHQSGDEAAKAAVKAAYTSSYQSSLESNRQSSWMDVVTVQPSELPPVNRPGLPHSSFDDDDEVDVTCSALYDFTAHEAWLDHPLKRLRYDVILSSGDSRSGRCTPLPSTHVDSPSNQRPAHDPYEFSDEASSTITSSGFTPPRDLPGRPAAASSAAGGRSGGKEDQPQAASRGGPLDEQTTAAAASRRGPLTNGPTTAFDEALKSRENGQAFAGKDDIGADCVIDLGSLPSPTSVAAGGASSSLINEKDLVPTYTDLDRIFESDDDSMDDMMPHHVTGGACNGVSKLVGADELTGVCGKAGYKQGQSLASSHSAPGTIGPQELSTMFPTPPSMETINTSPCGHIMDHHGNLEMLDQQHPSLMHHHHHHHLPLSHHAPTSGAFPKMESVSGDETTPDCHSSCKPAITSAFLGSKKYAPIELPSSKLPAITLPPAAHYKPSWQYALPIIDKPPMQIPQSQYSSIPSIETIQAGGGATGGPRSQQTVPSQQQQHDRLSVPASPAAMYHASSSSSSSQQQQQQQRTPLSYELLQSPASNASSYMNKNLSSVDNHGTNSQNPEAYSLIVNITLSDTVLTIFKDHNFDSCNICVCNMSIKGADVGLYLPDANSMEPQYRCACGFSAIMNRKYAFNSGLFYEDEVEITQKRDDRFDYRKPALSSAKGPGAIDDGAGEVVNDALFRLLRTQFCSPYTTCSVLQQLKRIRWSADSPRSNYMLSNRLEFEDGYKVCDYALEQGRQAMEHCGPIRSDEHHNRICLHKWPHIQAIVPKNTQDVVRLLKSIQPLLQDAIQKKRTTRLWEATYTITGPLTWKDFHKLAGRGTEEACEPQPIPSLLVGYDKDWLSVAPHSIRYWEKLLLEPYRRPRDVAYVVVAPDNDYLLAHMRKYFKELSSVYELCRLGRHAAISKVLRDGIMRVGRSAAKKLADEDVNEWFIHLGDSSVAAKLRLYAQVCRHHLAPHLAEQSLDRSLFESPPSVKSVKQAATPLSTSQPSPHTPLQDTQISSSASTPQSVTEDKVHSPGDPSERSKEPLAPMEPELEDDDEHPTIVVYMIDPFSYGDDGDDTARLSMLGLLRCFHELIDAVPQSMHDHVKLQIIPLQCILDTGDESAHFQNLKAISFSVYTQSCHPLSRTIAGRTLTGFGTAAAAETFLKQLPPDASGPVTLYTPPFILAGRKVPPSLADPRADLTHMLSSHTLFCCYCLSEDQRWLIAVCTDERGELLETCTINIDIPNRNRRKKASARKSGLSRLWEFLVGLIAITCQPWRVVISRFGRLGHGEMRGWAGLLGRKNLLNVNKYLREKCEMCVTVNMLDSACVLSACLIAMEVQPTFRVMPDVIKVEEEQSSNIPCTTPRDASCTHILVFPTSATAAANSTSLQQESHIDIASSLGADIGDDDPLFSGLKEDLNLDQDLNAIFNLADSPVPSPGSPGRAGPGSPMLSPGLGPSARNSPQFGMPTKGGGMGLSNDPQDELPNLLQQPLAMGYYVSTTQPGPIPRWMWSSTAHMESNCPTCFKFSLHIHCPGVTQNQDDLLHTTTNRPSHPLDSNFTCDVLRSVLEIYNSLSWLTMDVASNDRRSCLPHHFMVLMQMYNALDAFI